eukprot:CAMPEP_0170562226 /NCGR_PEP_ID=MMETSP0211-20121228/59466_1 /TAXON_ID=311385 /ORGANISM="Pseudokeronopsis sp., Strain OXSARD2" /LENGTH=305 /DNA_ID=CAMNT_0010878837 /DNA_START=381 /DNA_END=1293 /DNA_ORIENTATION=-
MEASASLMYTSRREAQWGSMILASLKSLMASSYSFKTSADFPPQIQGLGVLWEVVEEGCEDIDGVLEELELDLGEAQVDVDLPEDLQDVGREEQARLLERGDELLEVVQNLQELATGLSELSIFEICLGDGFEVDELLGEFFEGFEAFQGLDLAHGVGRLEVAQEIPSLVQLVLPVQALMHPPHRPPPLHPYLFWRLFFLVVGKDSFSDFEGVTEGLGGAAGLVEGSLFGIGEHPEGLLELQLLVFVLHLLQQQLTHVLIPEPLWLLPCRLLLLPLQVLLEYGDLPEVMVGPERDLFLGLIPTKG